ncbi:hypothetical protein ABZX65_07290 [Streptomyces sp. NPDC003300]|uniref:hypothetical protein n=1 Tax=unclassified Streptomyces TaxID=2593676 RepID=UPI0033B31DED
MTILAVTGHMDLTDASVPLLRAALGELMRDVADGELVGVSCIAAGADSLFAEAVLDAGGSLVAVIPSRDYRETKVKDAHAAQFDRLLAAATEAVVMDHATAGRDAYEAANSELLRRADRLVAVWNGMPPGTEGGGTADVVEEARALGIPVTVIWPTGAARRIA